MNIINKSAGAAKFTALISSICALLVPLHAATKYVDNSISSGANDGSSWANAWTSITAITGLNPGDIVYISGGPSGTSQTYNLAAEFTSLPGYSDGTSGNPISYQIGQDSAHNGTAIFNHNTAGGQWLFNPGNVIFSGNAGDGLMHFKITNYSAAFVMSGKVNVHISYLDCGNMASFGSINPGNGIEIDHCYINVNDLTADHAYFGSFTGATYTDNSIHDCTILIPNSGPGLGADGLQMSGTGYSVYNNTITGYSTAYTGGQHQDGWQAGGGSKIKIYNNVFVDIGNYAVFGEANATGYTDLYIYNNLMFVTNPAIQNGGSAAVAVGTGGGYFGPSPCVFDHVVIANNIAVDYGTVGQLAFGLNNVTGSTHPSTFTNCQVVNNITLNSPGISTQGNITSTVANNVSISKANGPANFVSYTELGGTSNNLHSLLTGLAVVDLGSDLSAIFTNDKDTANGVVARPKGQAWDIGPYELTQTTPLILTQPITVQNVANGATVTISVLARGQAPVTFQWKKDGVALTNGGVVSGATSATLTLTGVTNTETATYTVDVNNALGPLVTSTASVLNVNAVPPSFTTQPPATQTVVAGATATITFVAAGTPTPTYQWKKNGVNLTDGGNVSGSTSTTLTLTNVSPADTATYTVVADNTIAPSATSNNSVLNVNVPSAITTQPPATLTVNVGGTATITAAASGIPTPTYQWQKNGVNISGATSATLTLTPLVIGDAGTYKVIATNVAGVATSSNSVLTVNYPPSYTTQPAATQTINAGGSVTFTAAASGVPTPTYQWQKNGVNITGATNATLTINSLVPGDAGTYTVITTNSLGAVTSSNAVLTVNYAPVITAQPAAAQTINVGNSVTYSVTVAGSPAPTYQWQKNSVDIVGATSSTLTLSGLALTDSGTYTVTATNSLGNATSNNAVLTVVLGFAPVFTTSPVGATILLNNPITFTAAATGTPAPTFQWQKDGVAITGATGTSYTIPSVQATDGGVYTVVATNIVGPVTSAGATLVVNLVPPPAISAQPKSLTVASGHSVSFQAGATNGAAYQWQVSADGGASWNAVSNSSTYSGSTTSTLTVTGASTSMNGYQYRVVATNSTSTVTSAAATLAVVTPVFPSPVDVAPNSKGNVLVDDSGTDVIQSVSSAGVATLLAGSAGKPGSTDDNGSYASFRVPGGFVLDSSGNLYLADTGNNLIRKITADGSVTTIAGQPGFQGFQDGAGSAAWFNLPGGITIDGSGNLYVADTGNSIIRKITPGGATVSTVAGSPSLRGTTNGTGSAARFNQPYGITSDSAGNLYVADTLNQTIRKITPAGVVTTFAGAPGVSGSADGNGLTDALFNHPLGITIDAAGNLYVSDSGNNTIRLIKPDGTVSTLAGLPTIAGLKDGTGTDAWFNQPIGVRLDSAGTTLYVADNGNAAIRRVTLAGAVTTWAITQGTSAPSTPNPTPTPTPTTSGGSTNLPPSSTGGGGGAFDGWFIAALSVLSIMRWRRRPA